MAKAQLITPVGTASITDSAITDRKQTGLGRTRRPRIVTIIGGHDDENAPSPTNCTRSVDTTNFRIGDRAWKMSMAGAVVATVIWDPVHTGNDPFLMGAAAAICMDVYCSDHTKVTSIAMSLYSNADLETVGYKYTRTFFQQADLSTGAWIGKLIPSSDGIVNFTTWGEVHRITITVSTNAACDVTIGRLYALVPAKAQLLFCMDRGYKTFYDNAYPDLVARGIPVTYNISPTLMGTGAGLSEVIDETELAAIMAVNHNSISFHSWDGAVMSEYTAAQVRADTMKCLKWLAGKGYRTLWRGAWTQNSCAQHAAAQPLLPAYGTPVGSAAAICWPYHNRYNLPRSSLHGMSTADVTARFALLKATHQLQILYTHGYDAGGGNNVTPAQWTHFLSEIDTGLSEGWLEGVTFEMLAADSGWRCEQDVLGDWFNIRRAYDGTESKFRIP